MVDQEVIQQSLDKSSEFILNLQSKDGSWSEEAERFEYRLYQQPLILTSEAIQALIFAIKPDHIKAIQKGMNFCFKEQLDDKVGYDLHAWRFAVLNISNSEVYTKEKIRIKKLLLAGQNKEGFWHSFPRPNMLTNFAVIQSLRTEPCNKEFKKHRTWLKDNKTKDQKGWAFEINQDQAEVTFTAEAILNLAVCGEPPTSKEIQDARKFLEKHQHKDGYWSNVFEGLPCAHTTSICTIALMLSSEEPFNERVEKAVKYLVENQTEEGYYIKRAIHHIYYVHFLLSFYLFMQQYWKSNTVKNLKQHIKAPADVAGYLFRIFGELTERRFQRAFYASVVRSRMLGTTKKAVNRRLDILRILDREGAKTTAEIIDSLKVLEGYRNLNKKSHLTQIKSDVDFLRGLNLIDEDEYKYFSSFKVF